MPINNTVNEDERIIYSICSGVMKPEDFDQLEWIYLHLKEEVPKTTRRAKKGSISWADMAVDHRQMERQWPRRKNDNT